jgi:hypothetical protein
MAESLGISSPIAPLGLDHRLHANAPVGSVTQRGENPAGGNPKPAPSTQLAVGTTVEAVVRGPAPAGAENALAIGTRLLLRIVAPTDTPAAGLFLGRILDSASGETLISTPLGVLALMRRLALEAGSLIAFERIEQFADAMGTLDAPSTAGSWPALDEALAVLTDNSPAIAAQLRAALMPGTAPQLIGTLLFLIGALYRGTWPNAATISALTAAGHADLAKRLGADAAELKRLSDDPTTGDWRVLILPFMSGPATIPLRLFMRRPKPGAPAEDGTRFTIEIELSRFGPMQLDAMVRERRLILVVRSHRSLPRELCQDAGAAFRRAMPLWGMTGDISFATQAQFALAPLSGLRKHIAVTI